MLTVVDDPLVVQRANDLVLAVTNNEHRRKASIALQKAVHQWLIKVDTDALVHANKAKDGAIEFGHAIELGFNQYTVDEYKWYQYEFDDVKKIIIPVEKKGWAEINYMEIAKTPNAKYVIGTSINLETCGSSRTVSIFDRSFDDPVEALEIAKKRIQEYCKYKADKSAKGKKIIKFLDDLNIEQELAKIGLLTTSLPIKQPQQLELFS
jgi:hypothetical protein